MNVDFFRAYLLHPPTARHQQRAAGKLAIVAGLSIDEREATMLLSNYSDDLTKIELMWKGFNWTGGVTAEIRTIDVANDFSDVRTEVVDGEKALIRLLPRRRLRPPGQRGYDRQSSPERIRCKESGPALGGRTEFRFLHRCSAIAREIVCRESGKHV